LFLLLQNASVLEVLTCATSPLPWKSISPLPQAWSQQLILTHLSSRNLLLLSLCERERETLLLHLIPDLVHSVCVDLVNKKLDDKKKEKHRRWGSEAFFIQRYAKWKIMGTILLSLTTSLPLSPDHSNSISSSTSNGINMREMNQRSDFSICCKNVIPIKKCRSTSWVYLTD
jgi:hypothetical protein